MQDVICGVIPLYKFSIDMKSDDGKTTWDEYIISDTISGIQTRIIEWEIGCGIDIKSFRKRLAISDFLLMLCETNECKKGYKLFDIDNHDCAEIFGASHEEEYYHCVFEGERPLQVTKIYDDEEFVSKLKEVFVGKDDIDNLLREGDIEECFARVLYNGTLNHPYRRKLMAEQKLNDDYKEKLIKDKLQKMIYAEVSISSKKSKI